MPTAIINGKKVVVPKGHEAVEIDGVMTIVSAAEAARLRKVSVAAGGAAVSRRDTRSTAEKANDAALEKLADPEFRDSCQFYRLKAINGVKAVLPSGTEIDINSDLLKDNRKVALNTLVAGAIVAVTSKRVKGTSFSMFMGEKIYSEAWVEHRCVICVVPDDRASDWNLSV